MVDLPGQSKQAVPSWLNSYLLVLQTVCLEDQYLLTKLAAVNHMIAPPTVLFMPDVALRVLWRWLGGQARAFQQTTTSNAAAVPGSNT